jgi:hypothetical protein
MTEIFTKLFNRLIKFQILVIGVCLLFGAWDLVVIVNTEPDSDEIFQCGDFYTRSS